MGSDWEKFKKGASPLEEVRRDREKVWAKKVKNPILNVKKWADLEKIILILIRKLAFEIKKYLPIKKSSPWPKAAQAFLFYTYNHNWL